MSAIGRRIGATFLIWVAAFCFSRSAQDKQPALADHLQKAKQFLDEKRPDLAIPELQAAADIDPENLEIQANLGVLLYFQGKPIEAVPHLRMAVAHSSGIAKIQGLLGLAEVRTLDLAQGRKDLEAAFPSIGDMKFKVEVGLELVSQYTQTGDLDEAAAILMQLRRVAPDNPEVLYAAYRTYSDLTVESMLALSLSAPDSAQMHQMLAHEERRQGNTTGAIEQYHQAISVNPRLPGIHFELAELLYSSDTQSAKQQAEHEYRTALAQDPQDEKAVLRLAEIDAQKGNTQQAYEGYEKAVKLQPADADAKLGLAKTLIEMDRRADAIKVLEETVQLDPTNATAHFRLGTQYREAGRIDDAKKEIELYKKYKDMKEKLSALYKELQIQPKEITADDADQK